MSTSDSKNGDIRIGNCSYDKDGKLTGHYYKVVEQYWDHPDRDNDPFPEPADSQFPDLFPPGLDIRDAWRVMQRGYWERGLRLPQGLSESPRPTRPDTRFLAMEECSVAERELMAYNLVVTNFLKENTRECCIETLKQAFREYQVTYVVP